MRKACPNKVTLDDLYVIADQFWGDLARLAARADPRNRRLVLVLGVIAFLTSETKHAAITVADATRTLH